MLLVTSPLGGHAVAVELYSSIVYMLFCLVGRDLKAPVKAPISGNAFLVVSHRHQAAVERHLYILILVVIKVLVILIKEPSNKSLIKLV